MQTVEERVETILIESMGVPKEKIFPKAILIEDFGMDSLDAVEIVMMVEEEFGIEVPDAVAERVITVEDMIQGIKSRLSPSSPERPCPECGGAGIFPGDPHDEVDEGGPECGFCNGTGMPEERDK